MFSNVMNKRNTRWIAGTALGLAMMSGMAGVGSAHAASMSADLSSNTAVMAPVGSTITITGSSFGAGEPVGFWINVPGGTVIDAASLGQSNTYVDGSVIPLNEMGYADDTGAISYTLNTDGLPVGEYSLVAHGLQTKVEKVLQFTIRAKSAADQVKLTSSGDTTMAAGDLLTVSGASFGANESVGFWINVPDGTVIDAASLGQSNTYVDGSVIALNDMASTDDAGAFTSVVDTTGLPSGNYSLVAHGLNSQIEGVISFTIK